MSIFYVRGRSKEVNRASSRLGLSMGELGVMLLAMKA